MMQVAGGASRADDAFDEQRVEIDKQIVLLEALVTACNAALQQTGVPPQSAASPPVSANAGDGSGVRAAVESAKFKVK